MKKYDITIEEVERISGTKLTYPNQHVVGDINEEKYKELRTFGCSDIWDDRHTCTHRDCFHRICDRCSYYPIKQKYDEEHTIDPNMENDFVKILYVVDILNDIEQHEKK